MVPPPPSGPGYEKVELVWPGKTTEVERVSLPFQTIERVNEVSRSAGGQARLRDGGELPDWWPEGWRNKLIWGDNKYVLSSLLDEFAGKVDLIYIDPPFATGADFSYKVEVGKHKFDKEPTILEQVAYNDTWRQWQQFFYERMIIARDLLKPNGSLYVHLDSTVGHSAKLILDEIFGDAAFQREIAWRIGWISGYKSAAQNWIRNHDVILYYTVSPANYVFNPQYLENSEAGKRRGGSGKLPGYPVEDVWNGNRFEHALTGSESLDSIQIKSFSKEKTGFPTQKNLSLLKRVIRASSNEGSLVVDFFAGSGTTLVAAESLGRRWIGADLGRFAIHTTRKRMLGIPHCRPFEVLNLGRYERSHWQGADVGEQIGEYYDFIVQLYGATRIQGFNHLHGIKDGRMVHVGATDAPVTAEELDLAISECAEGSTLALDVLGWEWEMGLNPSRKDELAHFYEVDVHLLNIPREVMDQKAVEAGDIHFFELSVVELRHEQDDRGLVVEIESFTPAVDEYMAKKVGDAIERWSDWIDYWSIDFDYDGETFVNSWQSYRTRQDPSLSLISDPHRYDAPGRKTVVVKVIDIFGNDTTRELTVEVE